ncbi:MAG TPA: alpha/beta hydrolase [Solirubrobacteraceae bacterium]|jgi:pimeloyl-ACP methyl ester carboxylesterase
MDAERFEVDGIAGERRDGRGTPVVLLHAGVADRRGWHGVMPRLDAPVVAYDRRGFGETPPGGESFSHLGDLWTVLDATVDGPVWLVGNSKGGSLALDAALERPERVAGVVLIAAGVSGAPYAELDPGDPVSDAFDARFDAAAGDLGQTLRLDTWLWLDGPAQPEGRVGGAARELARDMNRRALAHGLPEDAGAPGVDAWSRLEEVRVPVTFVACELDVPLLATVHRAAAARIPGARVRELSGVAHLPALEDPAAVAAVIAEATAAG